MSEKFLDPARHEPADVGGRFIWAGVALVLASTFVLGLIVLWLYPGATTDRTLRLPLLRYPDPQLQPDPAADMRRFRDEEMRQLNGAGWVDKANRIAHIPITDAKRKIAEENIPGWPGAPPPVARADAPASPAPAEAAPRSAGDGSKLASIDGGSPCAFSFCFFFCSWRRRSRLRRRRRISAALPTSKNQAPKSPSKTYSATTPAASCGWTIFLKESR